MGLLQCLFLRVAHLLVYLRRVWFVRPEKPDLPHGSDRPPVRKWHHLGIIFFKRVVFFWLTQRL